MPTVKEKQLTGDSGLGLRVGGKLTTSQSDKLGEQPCDGDATK